MTPPLTEHNLFSLHQADSHGKPPMAAEQEAELCFPSGSSSTGHDLLSLGMRTQRESRAESRSCTGTEPQPHSETEPGRLAAPRGCSKGAQNVTRPSEGPQQGPTGSAAQQKAKGQETGSGCADMRTSSCTSENQTGKRGWERENDRGPCLNTSSRLEHEYPKNEHTTPCQVSTRSEFSAPGEGARSQPSRTFPTGHYDPAALGAGKPFPGITRWHCSSFKPGLQLCCTHEMPSSIWEERDLNPCFLYISSVISHCSRSFQRPCKSCTNNKEITASGGGGGKPHNFLN